MKVNKDPPQTVQMLKGHRVIKQEKSFEFAFAMKILKKNKNRNKNERADFNLYQYN